MRAFNLLQYPALARQRRRVHRRWTFLAGLLVGGSAAFLWMAQIQEKRQLLELESALLEARLKYLQNRLVADKARLAEQKTWQQQAAHVQALKVELKAWEAFYQALLQEAGPDSVQLLRLQLDAQTLELHGQAIDVQRMALAHARLPVPMVDAAQSSAWTLVSLMNASGVDNSALPTTQEFVWQAHWPQLSAGQAAGALGGDMQKAESIKGRP